MKGGYLAVLLIACVGEYCLHASDQVPGAKQERPIVLIGATIHPISGPEFGRRRNRTIRQRHLPCFHCRPFHDWLD
jgi:hypothetical protein